jgi:hypothetical protein
VVGSHFCTLTSVFWFRLSLRFAEFQIYLAEAGCLLWIHSGLEVSFFQEISPAFVPVFRTLLAFQTLERHFSVRFSLDDGHNATGNIGSQVIADYSEGAFGFVPHAETPQVLHPSRCFFSISLVACPPFGGRALPLFTFFRFMAGPYNHQHHTRNKHHCHYGSDVRVRHKHLRPPFTTNYRGRTFSACQPFGPLVTSNSTLWPSCKLRKPPA